MKSLCYASPNFCFLISDEGSALKAWIFLEDNILYLSRGVGVFWCGFVLGVGLFVCLGFLFVFVVWVFVWFGFLGFFLIIFIQTALMPVYNSSLDMLVLLLKRLF